MAIASKDIHAVCNDSTTCTTLTLHFDLCLLVHLLDERQVYCYDGVLQIQQIWLDVLHHDQISVSADFFQIGGTSLLAVLVASKIQMALGVELQASQLFTDKTIADLAATVSRLQSSSVSTSGSNQENSTPVLTPQAKSRGVYCTLNQEIMILLHQLSPEAIVYSMPFAIRLSGPLDVNLLNRSLQIVVQRQEVLLCHLTGKLISKNFLGKAFRGLMRLSLNSSQVLTICSCVDLLVHCTLAVLLASPWLCHSLHFQPHNS